jgi:hypothetical protein
MTYTRANGPAPAVASGFEEDTALHARKVPCSQGHILQAKDEDALVRAWSGYLALAFLCHSAYDCPKKFSSRQVLPQACLVLWATDIKQLGWSGFLFRLDV